MPTCYTCQEEIIFDKHILSKTGKQIPLWPDKQNTHGHDEAGKPVRGQLPNQNLTPQQTEQFNQYNRQQPSQQQRMQVVANKTAQIGSSSGGSYMDTKRIRVMLEEHTKEIQEIKMMLNEILNARTILDTNRYEGKNDQIYNVIAPFLNTQGVVASELLKDKQQQQQQRDPLSINHGKIADLNETRDKAAKSNKPIIDESRERIPNEDFPIEQTLTDDDDDTKGVIDDL